MESGGESGEKKYTLAKGFIHGRDASFSPVYGAFICLSAAERTNYVSAIFVTELIDPETSLADLMARLGGPRPDDEDLARYETELCEYINISRIFQGEYNALDGKVIERKISYFCTDSLQLSAITFVDLMSVGEDDLDSLAPSLSAYLEVKHEKESDSEDEDDFEGRHEGGAESVYIACEPVLDPVQGVAVSELAPGDVVFCRIPNESSFYLLLKNNSPNFDGTVTGDVTGVKINEFGSSVVSLTMADGVYAAMKMAGTVRIKLKSKGAQAAVPGGVPDVLIAVGGIALFLCILGAVIYILR
ncbi:MAG: hypothetical protein LBQ56_01760 [Synergistaceae bacterium]|jgi:hypothetical protein|nr:hypothetical protein [Synergistaceae bacterium]